MEASGWVGGCLLECVDRVSDRSSSLNCRDKVVEGALGETLLLLLVMSCVALTRLERRPVGGTLGGGGGGGFGSP